MVDDGNDKMCDWKSMPLRACDQVEEMFEPINSNMKTFGNFRYPGMRPKQLVSIKNDGYNSFECKECRNEN